jgi:hypothetical protein
MYLNTPYNRGFSFPLVEELLFSLVPTLFIHLLCLLITLPFGLRFDDLYLIVISEKTGAPAVDREAIYGFLSYCMLTYVVAWLFGLLVQRLAMRFNWDINFPLFLVHNEWYYLLRGMLVTSGTSGRRKFIAVDTVQVDAVVDIAGVAYIYTGIISDFVLSKQEGIDRIYLSDTIRRPLAAAETVHEDASRLLTEEQAAALLQDAATQDANVDETQQLETLLHEEGAYYISGTRFCLLFKEIKNLNLTYTIEQEV